MQKNFNLRSKVKKDINSNSLKNKDNNKIKVKVKSIKLNKKLIKKKILLLKTFFQKEENYPYFKDSKIIFY